MKDAVKDARRLARYFGAGKGGAHPRGASVSVLDMGDGGYAISALFTDADAARQWVASMEVQSDVVDGRVARFGGKGSMRNGGDFYVAVVEGE